MSTAPLDSRGAGVVSQPAVDAIELASTDWSRARRLGGLHRFAAAITFLNILGHGFLGFETSWAHPVVALATAYALELLLEFVDARATHRPMRFLEDGAAGFVNFLLSAHISALAVSMLLYPNGQLLPVVFATAAAIGSKAVFRATVEGRTRHVMNPSNFGISLTLVLFPWVGIAAPYQFTENVAGFWDWALPLVIICTGSLINFRFTSRLPLLCAWLVGFVAQAALRSLFLEASFVPSLAPMTGLAFLLFTFYMVTDPATTPSSRLAQVSFGLAVAAAYGLLMAAHVVFGLFFALAIVCAVRGVALWLGPVFRRA